MSGDQLDLDAKVRRYDDLVCPTHGTAACSAVFNGCTFLAYLNRAGEDVRALVAEVRRLREQVRDTRPRMTICNDGDNHAQPCDCGRRRRIPLPRPPGCYRHPTDAHPGDCPDCRDLWDEAVSRPGGREDVPALVAEVRRLREWQRKVSDACGLTEIHMGYTPWVPDATPSLLAMIEDTFTRSLYHAECERVEWEEAAARGEV